MIRRLTSPVSAPLSGPVRTIALLAIAVCATVAVAGPAARGVTTTGGIERAHGWVILEHPAADAESALVHLPPRGAGGGGGAEPGSARRARVLAQSPEALAARGDTVFLIQRAGAGPDGSPVRRVAALRAVPTPVEGVWAFDPRDRLRPLPPLLTAGEVGGAGIVGGALTVLLLDDDTDNDTKTGPRLARLSANTWTIESLALDGVFAVAVAADAELRLLSDADRAVLLVRTAASLTAIALDAEGMPGPPRTLDAPPFDRVPDHAAAGELLWVEPDRVVSWRPGSATTRAIDLADAPEGPTTSVVLGSDGGRLALITDPAPEGPTSHVIGEYQLATGTTLYAGPVLRSLPVSPAEFRLLAAFLVALTAGTLLVAIRPAPDPGVCGLPEGWSLAEPVRRIAATGVDLIIAIGLVSYASDGGRPLTIITLIVDPTAWLAIPAVLTVGAAMAMACEAVFGRSIGKMLCGCRVVRCGVISDHDRSGGDDGAGPGRLDAPGFGPIMVRNLIKWYLCPLTLLALIDGSGGRHRGDAISRTVVVVRTPPEPASSGDA